MGKVFHLLSAERIPFEWSILNKVQKYFLIGLFAYSLRGAQVFSQIIIKIGSDIHFSVNTAYTVPGKFYGSGCFVANAQRRRDYERLTPWNFPSASLVRKQEFHDNSAPSTKGE